VAFAPDVEVVSRVTQGCTPVGPVRTLTGVEGNVALTLDGEPALEVLLADLSVSLEQPQAAMSRLRNTLVGLSPAADAPWSGARLAQSDLVRRAGQLGADVRVRHIIGLDPARHGVAVADAPQAGEQVVFCTRNAEAARADLMRMCAEIREDLETPQSLSDPLAGNTSPAGSVRVIRGAIYVSCAGRGGPHFGSPHAEMQWVRRALGDVPLVGFFAGGEIAHQQLYGYTGVLTVFVSDADPAPLPG
jgi:small ligand-binding sensory domain FIST